MKKILILGSPGSGKSTTAIFIGNKLNIKCLHIDKIFWKKDWISDKEQAKLKMEDFLNNNDNFVIDGGYLSLNIERRIKESDTIIYLNITSEICLKNALNRVEEFKDTNRPTMTQGCNEKIDDEFMDYIKNYKKDIYPRTMEKINQLFKGELIIINNYEELNKLKETKFN